jgi:hypothetical protein
MTDNETMDSRRTRPPGRNRLRLAGAAGLIAAGAVAGGVLAGSLTASAADTSTSGTTANSTATAPAHGPGGPAPVRSDETQLTGNKAARATAAAKGAVPGGTVVRVETDAGDATYEVHMTKADGTLVTVKLDASFAVTKVEDGMGAGDPRGGRRGPDSDSDGSGTSGGTSGSGTGA